MSTNAEFYDRVLQKARREGDTVLRPIAIAECEELLQTWERGPFHPWFLEKVSSDLATVASTQTLAVPSDFLLIVENTKIRLEDADGDLHLLKRGYHEDLEEKFLNADADQPWSYDIFANLFWFGPVPDAEYPIHCKYYMTTTVPPDDDETLTNPWILNAKELVVTSVAHRLVRDYIKDEKRAKSLGDQAAVLRSELHKYSEARKHADMDYEIDR